MNENKFSDGWVSLGTGWHFGYFDNFTLSLPDEVSNPIIS
jgi:hypothetical protein